jgi:UDP-N-acetylmuramate: L-alanyl-gamma-D-glutamyl-meso-diaminopimelate ligase
VARMDQLPPDQRLNPEKVVTDLKAAGKEAFYEPDTASIIDHVGALAGQGDVIVVFSNGGFDNIHAKLLEHLKSKA